MKIVSTQPDRRLKKLPIIVTGVLQERMSPQGRSISMRFLTAGESHGPQLTVIVDDVPRGVPLTAEWVNTDLRRRQVGYGRGGRMQIETDTVHIKSGVRFGHTTGAPIALVIENRDYAKWVDVMAVEGEPPEHDEKRFTRPRPGHADLAAHYKYGLQHDLRDALERASARETAARVAAGAVAKALLTQHGILMTSHVTLLGGIAANTDSHGLTVTEITHRAEANDLRTLADEATYQAMKHAIDEARMTGTTLGGEIEVVADGVPAGLGSYAQWDRKLDGLLAQAVMSVQAVKSVSIGAGATIGQVPGHMAHDPIEASETGTFTRPSNHAGGLEAGVTNGMPVVVRAMMKPIATMRTALPSVNLETGETETAHFERSDVTAVPACGVVCEAMVALTLATAWQQRHGEAKVQKIQTGNEN